MSVWVNMVHPFRRKDKDGEVNVSEVDEDINALLDSEPFEEFSNDGTSD